MLTVAVPKRNKLPNIIVLTPKDGKANVEAFIYAARKYGRGARLGCMPRGITEEA